MLSINKTQVLTHKSLQQKTLTQQPALNTQTMAKDTVSFNGGMGKATALAKTKGGIFGLIGLMAVTIFGVASTAKAHDLYANNGRLLAHEHQVPGNQSTSVYVDRHGNWGLSTSNSGSYTVNHGGDQEMMKVGRNKWQAVRRVFDENNNQKFVKYGQVVKRNIPIQPRNGFRIPPHVKNHLHQMQQGQVIIINPGHGHGHGHGHHNQSWRDDAIDRSFNNIFGN